MTQAAAMDDDPGHAGSDQMMIPSGVRAIDGQGERDGAGREESTTRPKGDGGERENPSAEKDQFEQRLGVEHGVIGLMQGETPAL